MDQMFRGNGENPMSHPQNKQGDGAYLSSELIYQNFFTIHEAKVQFSTNQCNCFPFNSQGGSSEKPVDNMRYLGRGHHSYIT